MKILIAGASGFIGSELIKRLKANHHITVLGRNKVTLNKRFSTKIEQITWDDLASHQAKDYDVVMNLCGLNIAASRWSESVKKALVDSRVMTNQMLINWLLKQNAKPRFFCANAVGIYGIQRREDLASFDENSTINLEVFSDFLHEIGVRWQESLRPAFASGMPVVTMRFGVVLKKGEGMLKKLAPSFYLGAGSVVGDGKQIISWIHIDDLVSAILFLLDHPEHEGPFNLTSPHPVTQAEFAHTLAKAMHRPLWLRLPASVIKLLFGEMGECLLLQGQRVVPRRLLEAGFHFQYADIVDALRHEFSATA